MSNGHIELYEFDKFRLDVPERILWRSDVRVPLSEKAFDTLCSLVRRGNHLVSKDELLNEVWADAIVEENNLDKNISLLRQVLGERDGKGKFIETVRGHGFRFVPEVRKVADAEKSEPETVATGFFYGSKQSDTLDGYDKRQQSEIGNLEPKSNNNKESLSINRKTSRVWLAAGIGVAIFSLSLAGYYLWRENRNSVAAPVKTIAVLPFKPLIVGNRNEALEMGMADTLISKLSGGEITVRPLSSVRRFDALEQDSLAAGRELDVDAVLDGSIQISNERVRVSAKLLGVNDNKQLWAGQFDEKFNDIFAVQDAISEKVAAALKIRLAGREKRSYTENVEAYQLYMKGRFYVLKAIKPDTETSVSYFQQAIEADPNYALAYAGLADAYRGRSVGGEMPSSEFMPKARAAAQKAIEIDDTLAEGHAILGHVIFWYDWDWISAEKEYKLALELDPNSADALQFYAHLLSNTGRHTEALARIKRAREIDPLNLRINALEGLYLLHAGQTDEAIGKLQKTLELDSSYRLANMFVARAYTQKGMFVEAIAATHKVRENFPLTSEPVAYGSYALVESGELAEARFALDELLGWSKTRYVPPYNIALIYNALDERDKALEYLEKGFAEKDVRMVFLKVEPKWNNLRNEPRFVDLMRRMNFDL